MGGNDNGSKGGGNSKGNRDSYFIHDDNGTIDYRSSWVMNTFTLPTSSKQQTSQNTADRDAGIFVSFIGSQIQVLGMIQPGEDVIRANYSIDGGDPTTRRVPGLSQDVPLYNQMLYASPILDDGYHNLTVQMVEIGNGRNYSFQMFNVLTAGNNKTENNQQMAANDDGEHHHHDRGSKTAAIVGEKILFALEPASFIDTDSKFTFAARRDALDDPRQSWVSVNLPPTVPDSAYVNNRPISDWSSYKQPSVIVQQWHPELSRFSPYTSTALSPMAFGERTPRPAPSRRAGPPSQIETLTSSRTPSPRLSENRKF
ncbi:hypothetical protein A7U60_g2781 [Sanghuangporus baumii]|uniref:Uncharacterized protein n=1 Tax=Sanghuangporus baumii TaxID=108892 RepID=A0A9Q5I210_SANBA|nr:hypothetical protein A7U60_g2781 [Sanghuangporus baumii]